MKGELMQWITPEQFGEGWHEERDGMIYAHSFSIGDVVKRDEYGNYLVRIPVRTTNNNSSVTGTEPNLRPTMRRDRVSHRTIGDTNKLASARFKIGDVVCTKQSVKCFMGLNLSGYAAAGWKWRITKIRVDFIGQGNAKSVFYECVSHDEPRVYNVTLRDNQIDYKDGEHKGELFGPKVKPAVDPVERKRQQEAEAEALRKWRQWRDQSDKLAAWRERVKANGSSVRPGGVDGG